MSETRRTLTETRDRPGLAEMVRRAVEAFDKLSPGEKAAHMAAQRKSWVIGEMMIEHPDMTREQAERIFDDASSGLTVSTARGQLAEVLDHGFVRLVDHMGGDLSVVRSARVSYDSAWRAGEDEGSDKRLINYLWKHQHTTPFEAVTFTFEVKLPIFVVRQWHRHRTWTYNELSARYRQLPDEFYLPTPDIVGQQSKDNKQVRVINPTGPEIVQREAEVHKLRNACMAAHDLYRELLQKGWPRELARAVLPVNTYTHMFATCNMLNLFRFLTLRTHEHAQYEIRQYAHAIVDLVRPVAPVCVAAWEGDKNPNDVMRLT